MVAVKNHTLKVDINKNRRANMGCITSCPTELCFLWCGVVTSAIIATLVITEALTGLMRYQANCVLSAVLYLTGTERNGLLSEYMIGTQILCSLVRVPAAHPALQK
jgi:hypothetical protein